MVWRIALTEVAETDLESSVRFLAQTSQEAAERIGLELVTVLFSLDQLPLRGAPVKARPGIRRLIHRRHVIYYRLNEHLGTVEILRIWDGRRNPADLKLPWPRTSVPPPPSPVVCPPSSVIEDA